MKQPLYALNDDWSFAPRDVEDAFHPQQVVAMAQHQRVEPIGYMLPVQRIRELEAE